MTRLELVNEQRRGEVSSIYIDHHKIRQYHIVVGIGVNAVDLQLTLGRTNVHEIVSAPQVLVSEFEAVTALEPAEVLDQIPGLRNLRLGPPGRGPESCESGDLDRG